jgi:hypothetical protein
MLPLLAREKNDFLHSVDATAAYKHRRETQRDGLRRNQSANCPTMTYNLVISKFLLIIYS